MGIHTKINMDDTMHRPDRVIKKVKTVDPSKHVAGHLEDRNNPDWSLGGGKNFFTRVEGHPKNRGEHFLRLADPHRKQISKLFDLPCQCIKFPSTLLTPTKKGCGSFCSVFRS